MSGQYKTMFLISYKQNVTVHIDCSKRQEMDSSENFWLSKNLTSKRKKLNCEIIQMELNFASNQTVLL